MDNKSKLMLVIFLNIFIIYNAIGYIFDVDVLRFITLQRHEYGLSFVAILAPLITTYTIYFIIRVLGIDIKPNE